MLVLLFSLALAFENDPVCGTLSDRRNLITNGDVTSPGQFPWQVALTKTDGKQQFCGASLINQNWVLTAAHCVDSDDVTEDTLVMGIQDIDSYVAGEPQPETLQVREIKFMITHDLWDTAVDGWDFALIYFEDPVEYTDSVRPICLPENGAPIPYGEPMYIHGWGNYDDGIQPTEMNRYTKVEIHPPLYCAVSQAFLDLVDVEVSFCANSYAGDDKETDISSHGMCQGDSGGASVWYDETTEKWVQIGVASWNLQCGNFLQPDNWARLSTAITWVERIIDGYDSGKFVMVEQYPYGDYCDVVPLPADNIMFAAGDFPWCEDRSDSPVEDSSSSSEAMESILYECVEDGQVRMSWYFDASDCSSEPLVEYVYNYGECTDFPEMEAMVKLVWEGMCMPPDSGGDDPSGEPDDEDVATCPSTAPPTGSLDDASPVAISMESETGYTVVCNHQSGDGQGVAHSVVVPAGEYIRLNLPDDDTAPTLMSKISFDKGWQDCADDDYEESSNFCRIPYGLTGSNSYVRRNDYDYDVTATMHVDIKWATSNDMPTEMAWDIYTTPESCPGTPLTSSPVTGSLNPASQTFSIPYPPMCLHDSLWLGSAYNFNLQTVYTVDLPAGAYLDVVLTGNRQDSGDCDYPGTMLLDMRVGGVCPGNAAGSSVRCMDDDWMVDGWKYTTYNPSSETQKAYIIWHRLNDCVLDEFEFTWEIREETDICDTVVEISSAANSGEDSPSIQFSLGSMDLHLAESWPGSTHSSEEDVPYDGCQSEPSYANQVKFAKSRVFDVTVAAGTEMELDFNFNTSYTGLSYSDCITEMRTKTDDDSCPGSADTPPEEMAGNWCPWIYQSLELDNTDGTEDLNFWFIVTCTRTESNTDDPVMTVDVSTSFSCRNWGEDGCNGMAPNYEALCGQASEGACDAETCCTSFPVCTDENTVYSCCGIDGCGNGAKKYSTCMSDATPDDITCPTDWTKCWGPMGLGCEPPTADAAYPECYECLNNVVANRYDDETACYLGGCEVSSVCNGRSEFCALEEGEVDAALVTVATHRNCMTQTSCSDCLVEDGCVWGAGANICVSSEWRDTNDFTILITKGLMEWIESDAECKMFGNIYVETHDNEECTSPDDGFAPMLVAWGECSDLTTLHEEFGESVMATCVDDKTITISFYPEAGCSGTPNLDQATWVSSESCVDDFQFGEDETPTYMRAIWENCLKESYTTQDVTLEGNYDEVVTDKVKYLTECSEAMKPVDCTDVRPGSIIITLQGTAEQVEAASTEIETNGLDLPSFPAVPKDDATTTDSSSGSSSATIIIIVVCAVVLCCCIVGGIYMFTQMKQKDEVNTVNESKRGPEVP